MKFCYCSIVLFSFLTSVVADRLPIEVQGHPLVQGVLAQHYIHIRGSGRIEVAYPKALAMLELEDVLTEVQRAYMELLPEGEAAEFVITLEEAGAYSFVNRKQQHTRIEELLRRSCVEDGTDMVLHAAGTRAFGAFQSVTWIHVTACTLNPDESEWFVEVFAFPENSFSRFFARNMGIARRFFRQKTQEISELATEITLHLFEGT